jgi:hypothetical protein
METNLVKSAIFDGEPVFISKNGERVPYIARKITNHYRGYTAALHLVFQHTADVYMIMLEIIADKYGFNGDDMINAVMEDPRFKNVMMNPLLSSMNYFKKENMERVIPTTTAPPPAPAAPVDSDSDSSDSDSSDSSDSEPEPVKPKPKPRAKPRAKKQPKEAPAAPAVPAEEKPKKVVIRRKAAPADPAK